MQQPFNVFRVMAVALAVFVGNIGLAVTLLPASADGLNDGAKAYSAGDFTAAAGHWRPLAEAGDAVAGFELAGEIAGPADGADGGGDEGVGESDAAVGEGVDGGGFDDRVAEAGEGVPTEIVGEEENDVRSFGRFGGVGHWDRQDREND